MSFTQSLPKLSYSKASTPVFPSKDHIADSIAPVSEHICRPMQQGIIRKNRYDTVVTPRHSVTDPSAGKLTAQDAGGTIVPPINFPLAFAIAIDLAHARGTLCDVKNEVKTTSASPNQKLCDMFQMPLLYANDSLFSSIKRLMKRWLRGDTVVTPSSLGMIVAGGTKGSKTGIAREHTTSPSRAHVM